MGDQYAVRVRGHLADRWAGWFDGCTLAREPDGSTVLTGPAVDQAALHGLLRTLADLGLPLLAVTPIDTPHRDHQETTMTTAVPAGRATSRAETVRGLFRRMSRTRRIALAGGIAYLVTFAASIPQLALFAGIVDDPAGFISHPGGDTAVRWGSWLEFVTAAASVATAVFLYPVSRRVSRTAAVGFVTTRVVEAATIIAGTMCILAVLTLKSRYAGATGTEADALRVSGAALVATRQWSFLLGPGLIPGLNALFLGYAVYRGRLVPRAIPTIGLLGAPLILTSATVTILGGWDQVSPPATLLALPIAGWELALGLYLTVKGFTNAPADA
jgi:Domain of unknown function (DUF4386)